MPKSILVDLDVLLERPGCRASQSVLELRQTTGHTVHISAHIVPTFAYLLEHAKVPRADIRQHIAWPLRTFSVVSVN